MEEKVISFDKIGALVEKLRRKPSPPVVVLCHGCFDIVHPGHIRHLKFAREQGDFLIVSITPDSCVQKGVSRPYVPQDLRAENLAALEIVNAVTIAPADTGVEPISEIKPDVYVKGSEYAISKDPRFLAEKKLVEKQDGKVAYSSGEVVFSSTEFIRTTSMETANNVKLKFLADKYGLKRVLIDGVINKAPEKRFLIVGEPIIDQYEYCDAIGIAQESPVMSISLKSSSRYIGGAGALGMHLTSSGSVVTLFSSFDGNDPSTQFMRDVLDGSKIRLEIFHDKNRPINIKSHFFVNGRQVMELEKGPYRPPNSSIRAKILKRFEAVLQSEECPDCVIFSDFGYGLFSEDLVAAMTALAAMRKVPVITDIAMTLRTRIEKFYDSSVVSATELELRACLHDYESGLSVLVSNFYADSRVRELFLDLADGSFIHFVRPPKHSEGQNMVTNHMPPLMSKSEDKMGRSEAFTAGLALAKASAANPVQSMYLGAVFAAIHSSKIGNEPVGTAEVFNLLAQRKELL